MDWEYSVLREYLNKEFYSKAFSDSDKLKIVNVKLADVNNTKDNVFLLSKEEAETLMTQEERKLGDGNCNRWTYGYNCNNCYQYSDRHGTCFYLRTKLDNNCYYIINIDGGINYGYNVRSIRPSVWIKE